MNKFIVKYTSGVVLLGVIVLIIKGDFFSLSPIVIALQVVAVLVVLYARYTFRNQQFGFTANPGSGPLLEKGPYRIIRHPMYASVMLLIWASILGHWSIVNGLIGVIVLTFTLTRVTAEERLLKERYPEYTEYMARTRMMVPYIF